MDNHHEYALAYSYDRGGTGMDKVHAPRMNLLINIDVDDMSQAVAFYTQAFDLYTGRHLEGGVVEMLGAPVSIFLLAKPPGSQAASRTGPTRSYDRHWTPVHLDIVVDDIDKAILKAVKAGAVVERPTQLNAWGKLALMVDPFGNGFCLVQFLGRGYDEIATR